MLWLGHPISAENTHAVCRAFLAVPEVVFRKLLSVREDGGAAAWCELGLWACSQPACGRDLSGDGYEGHGLTSRVSRILVFF